MNFKHTEELLMATGIDQIPIYMHTNVKKKNVQHENIKRNKWQWGDGAHFDFFVSFHRKSHSFVSYFRSCFSRNSRLPIRMFCRIRSNTSHTQYVWIIHLGKQNHVRIRTFLFFLTPNILWNNIICARQMI